MPALHKAVALPARDKRLLLRALGTVLWVRTGLTLFSYNRVTRWTPRPAPAARPISRARIAWAVSRVARVVPGASCLTQALSVQMLLARQGETSIICIGVEPGGDDRPLRAHAWLVCDGRIVIGGAEAELARYAPIAELSPP